MDTKATIVNRKRPIYNILPYTLIVGQQQIKLALELAYIAPRIGGVLLSGQRGTAKSTAVRAFAQMISGKSPVTLPINATEDRVIGGWNINALMQSKAEAQPGLLEDANGSLLYIDEVNLLDDHIVNIILDVTSTGVLVVQREGQSEEKPVSFTLVGTMNPEEGGLRPQLLDRFGLMVSVATATSDYERTTILQTVLDFDEAVSQCKAGKPSAYINEALEKDQKRRDLLETAKLDFYNIKMPVNVARNCVRLAAAFQVEGNRGDYIIALAARAYAALEYAEQLKNAADQGEKQVINKHVAAVAQLVIQHRRPEALQNNQMPWSDEDNKRITQILSGE